MAAPVRRAADSFHWTSPKLEACSLTPMSGGQGMLEIEINDGRVIVHSRNCLLIQGNGDDAYTEVAEYEVSMSLDRCQINWVFKDKEQEVEVERSAYFSG